MKKTLFAIVAAEVRPNLQTLQHRKKTSVPLFLSSFPRSSRTRLYYLTSSHLFSGWNSGSGATAKRKQDEVSAAAPLPRRGGGGGFVERRHCHNNNLESSADYLLHHERKLYFAVTSLVQNNWSISHPSSHAGESTSLLSPRKKRQVIREGARNGKGMSTTGNRREAQSWERQILRLCLL